MTGGGGDRERGSPRLVVAMPREGAAGSHERHAVTSGVRAQEMPASGRRGPLLARAGREDERVEGLVERTGGASRTDAIRVFEQ